MKQKARVKVFLYFDQTYKHARGLSDPNAANPGSAEQNDETIAQWRAIVQDCHFGGPNGTCP